MYTEAMRELEKKKINIQIPVPEETLLPIPADLPSQGPTAAFAYYANALRHWDYVSTVDAELEATLIEGKANLAYVEAKCKKVKREPELDEEYIRCKRNVVWLMEQKEKVSVWKGIAHRRMQMISRSVEGIKLDYANTVRSGNLGRGPRDGNRGQLPNL